MLARPLRVLASPAFRNSSLNPYTSLLYRHVPGTEVRDFSIPELLARRSSIWHLHWPEMCLNHRHLPSALAHCLSFFSALDYARASGCRIVWTAHNLECHDRFHPRVENFFWKAFLRRVDGVITLTDASARSLLQRFPVLAGVPRFVIPHGHYGQAYPKSQGHARPALGIPDTARVILCFGAIRGYKNIPALVSSFRRMADPNLVLLIAGRPADTTLARQIQMRAANDARVKLCLSHIPPDEVGSYFQAADLVVLPYAEIQNSGTALLSLTMQRPVLVPAKGGMPELRDQVGDDWISTYTGELATEHLRSALDWAQAPRSGPDLSPFEWSSIGRKTLSAYKAVLAARSRSAEEPLAA